MDETSRTTLELLYNISRELTSDLDLRTVLSRVLMLSSRHVGAERASIIVLDGNQAVEGALIVNDLLLERSVEHWNNVLQDGLAGWVFRNRQAVMLSDTSQDERWAQRPDDAVSRTGAKSAICVPVMAREQVVGILTIVHPRPHFFNQEHLALVQSIADQAGIAIYNARLYDSLQAVTRRYRELFDDSIDPICITGLNGQILESNRQAIALTGYPAEVLVGKTMQELLKLPAEWLKDHAETLGAGQTLHQEALLWTASLSTVPVEVHVRKVAFPSGDVLQWILQDITERKQLDALRDDLMAMVYHDLRSPLSNIISSLEMLNMLLPVSDDENLRALLSIAIRSTGRMQRLINTLLDIYRLEAGQPITSRAMTEIAPLVYEAVDTILPVAENKGQQVDVQIEPNLPPLNIDADMIRRVLINLLDNATKYTLFKGKITLSVYRKGERVEFAVRDNGPGIPPDALEVIFDKFARLQSERFPKGIGLGLAFCRLAVRSHGGEIWVESKPNEGSCFTFALPIPQTEDGLSMKNN